MVGWKGSGPSNEFNHVKIQKQIAMYDISDLAIGIQNLFL